MAILNITYQGMSADYPFAVDPQLTDGDVRRVALEIVRSGGISGLHFAAIPSLAFDDCVVDRLRTAEGGMRIYLRPKVPFG
jgi:hypothetical protein